MTPSIDLLACTSTDWQATPDMALRTVILAGLLAMAGWAGTRRAFPGRGTFVAMVLMMVGWIGFSIIEHAAVDAACKGTLGLLGWGFMLPQPALWALFLYHYLNSQPRALPVPLTLVVWLPIVALVLLAWTNGSHGLFYGPDTALGAPIMGLPRLHYDRGPLFQAAMILGYVWLATALVLIFRGWRHAPPTQRAQRAAFLVMMGAPMLANLGYVFFGFRMFGVDPTSTTFGVAVVTFGWMIPRHRIFEVVPMARERLFAELPDAVFVLDTTGNVMDANHAAQRLIPGPAPIGQPLSAWPRVGAALTQHQSSASRLPLELADPLAFFVVQRHDLGAPGRPVGMLLLLHDVTERELSHHEAVRTLAARESDLQRATALQALLREQAMHDPLTGLLNRRALQERHAQVARIGDTRGQVLVLMDVDHFKQVNDSHGHAVGDAVLRDLAAALRSGLRAGDALFRVGGEEFAMLMPQASIAIATERVQALRELVGQWRLGGLAERVTFSAGVAEWHPARMTLDELLAAADKALYRAKRAGRDRIEVALAQDLA